jgi:hypothetical protein
MVTFVMAWSPVRRFKAGRFEVEYPGDYASRLISAVGEHIVAKLRPAGIEGAAREAEHPYGKTMERKKQGAAGLSAVHTCC